MKNYKLKKKFAFSLIVLLSCCIVLYSGNSFFNITGFLNSKFDLAKEKEMKYIYGNLKSFGDKYSESSLDSEVSNINNGQNTVKLVENNLTYNNIYDSKNIKLQNESTSEVKPLISSFEDVIKYQTIYTELKNQVELDSYRDKLGFYYVFNFQFTMDALKELEPVIEKTAEAHKVPKALITAVLFREMMFMGQEDMLDGIPIIGGKSIGICQIGIENARYNENTVHGKNSVIYDKSDEEIIEMLQNPNQAVYFCAVQLKARAIKLTGDSKINLSKLDETQMHRILEEYNQSKITKTIGPIKTKELYAKETYNYYKLFLKYYEFQ